jgi:hypothetical protein
MSTSIKALIDGSVLLYYHQVINGFYIQENLDCKFRTFTSRILNFLPFVHRSFLFADSERACKELPESMHHFVATSSRFREKFILRKALFIAST